MTQEKTNLKSVNICRIGEISAKPDHTWYLTESDIITMLKFASRLLKLGFKAKEVVKADNSFGSVPTVQLPELTAVFPVPCSDLRMGIRIYLYSATKIAIQGFRSDRVCTHEILGDDENTFSYNRTNFLEVLHDVQPDRWGNVEHLYSPDGSCEVNICKDKHDIQVAIGSFKTVYQSEIDHAITRAKEVEMAKQTLTNLNKLTYTELTKHL